jgi:hypothetical protein
LQQDYDSFLMRVDKEVNKSAVMPKIHIGSPGPCDIPLLNIKTDTATVLKDYLGDGYILLVLVRHFG